MNNLLTRLRKWVNRQDENFQTEAFVHLLVYLLENEVAEAKQFLSRLTHGAMSDVTDEELKATTVTTQVSVELGRPDVEIRSPRHLVYVEAKVESLLGWRQVPRYREELARAKAVGLSTWLTVLTKYRLEDGEAEPEEMKRWFEVADWLQELRLSSPVSEYLRSQFIEFLRARAMTIDPVNSDVVGGSRSLHNVLKMTTEILGKHDIFITRPVNWDMSSGYIGFYVENRRYWVGVGMASGDFCISTSRFRVSKEKATAIGHADGLFESQWPGETLGPWQFGRWTQLDSAELGLFSKSKAEQEATLEKFLMEFIAWSKLVEEPTEVADVQAVDGQ